MGHEVTGRHRSRAWQVAVLATCVFWNVPADAQEDAKEAETFALVADLGVSADTDGFHAIRTRLGGLTPYENRWKFSGVEAQSMHYTQGAYRQDAVAIMGVYRDQRRDSLVGIDAEAGVARIAGHLRPIGDVTLRLSTTLGTAVDLIASADLVETPKALERAIGYTFFAANAERQFGERLTATALAGWQHFSDGNARAHVRARLIWLAMPDAGITLQLRYRQYSTREADVGGAYFNPEDYRQWLVVAAVRRRAAGWIHSGALGAGQEHLTGATRHASYLVEARSEGPISADVRLVLRASYSRSAGFIDSPDYANRLVGGTLVLPFR